MKKLLHLLSKSSLLLLFLCSACNLNSTNDQGYKDESTSGFQQQNSFGKNTADKRVQETSTSIPQKAYDVLKFIKENGHAPDGYVGGRYFGNYEHHLAERDEGGNKIDYREWDVNPKVQGKNRGTERLITGSDGRAWYTNDHYNSFTEVK